MDDDGINGDGLATHSYALLPFWESGASERGIKSQSNVLFLSVRVDSNHNKLHSKKEAPDSTCFVIFRLS